MAGYSQILVALFLTFIGSSSTALGGALVVFQPTPNIKRLGVLQGFAAGLMLSLTFFDLIPNAIQSIGFAYANLWFFAGALMFAVVVALVPEPTFTPPKTNSKGHKSSGLVGDKDLLKKRRRQVLFSGIVTTIGISLHNLPEGIAVFLGSMKGLRVGVSLAFAIALHNIPEGVAVALPVYFATESKWQAFRLAALSGLAEPLGVVVVALFFPTSLSPEIIEGMLAAVGGIMAFLTLHEMMPLAFEYAGHRVAVAAIFIGMAVMSVSLQLLELSLPADIVL